jgi:hypothetical protein
VKFASPLTAFGRSPNHAIVLLRLHLLDCFRGLRRHNDWRPNLAFRRIERFHGFDSD